MLLPDPDASFREVGRVLADGGRYVTAVWAGPEHNPWILWTPIALMQEGVELPVTDPNGPGGIFSLSDAGVMRSRLEAAGLEVADAEEVDQPFDLTAAEAWALVSEITPLAPTLDALPPDRAAAVRAAVEAMSAHCLVGDRYVIPARSICFLAR
jgi:hypothetical protein